MKESQIQSAIEQVLRVYEKSGSCVYIKNNTGAHKTDHGAFIRFGKVGSSDFLLFRKMGKPSSWR